MLRIVILFIEIIILVLFIKYIIDYGDDGFKQEF